ncbi:MAG: IPT/TIG domain-containing protein [Planctomycetes bacterium]|nr:IPT/TIG domain-containing protein [Planctomycetota bacterium]
MIAHHRASGVFVFGLLAAPAIAQSDWVRLHPGTSPLARQGAAVAFDGDRHRVVLFGGEFTRGALALTDETLEWDGSSWKEKHPDHHPAARTGHALAYDSTRGRVVLFGGNAGNEVLADTWEWDGEDWRVVPTESGPEARTEHALAYDSIRRRTILFGGRTAGGRVLDDTWEWDGSTWSERTTPSSPPALAGHAMAFDAARGRIVLFGGDDGILGSRAETWEWDGESWWGVTTFGGPVPREHHTLAYDDASRVTVLFGGEWRSTFGRRITGFDDTWEWTGSQWYRIPIEAPPPAQAWHVMAYDSRCERTILVGSTRGDDPAREAETWSFGPRLSVNTIRPDRGSESGGDVMTIEGSGFTDASNTSVTIGGATASIIDLSCRRIRVRVPPGTGVGDVDVRSPAGEASLSSSFTFVPAEIAARFGAVDAAGLGPEDVLLVNGGTGDLERRLETQIGEPLWIYMKAPESRTAARFALWVWVGSPDATTISRLPRDAGVMVFPIDAARTAFNNLGRPRVLGRPTAPSSPAPTEIFRQSSGVRRAMTLTFQGIIEDPGALNAVGVSTTNAVVLRVVGLDCDTLNDP